MGTWLRSAWSVGAMPMSDVTRILSQIESGDALAVDQLLPLVYEELRKLAAAKLAQEKPGQTLQATALVHEAYLRLVNDDQVEHWDSRGHFFAAAAEAMRRIVVESARRKRRLKHGGGATAPGFRRIGDGARGAVERRVALDEALTRLTEKHPLEAELVKLRYFAGMTVEEAAKVAGHFDRNWRS